MSVTKMGNTVPRTGLETTSLAFRASVLPHRPLSLYGVMVAHHYIHTQCRQLHYSTVYLFQFPSIDTLFKGR